MTITLAPHEALYLTELVAHDIEVLDDILDGDAVGKLISDRITAKAILRKIGEKV